MLDDLNMTGVQYNIATSVFFVTYVIFGRSPRRISTGKEISLTSVWRVNIFRRNTQQLDTRTILCSPPVTLDWNNLYTLGDPNDYGTFQVGNATGQDN